MWRPPDVHPFIKTKQNKLLALGDPLKESELVGIFINGLSPIFHPVVVVLRGVAEAMPKTLDEAIDRTRRFAGQPAVAAELLRSKGGTTQHLYPAVSLHLPVGDKKPICKLYALGKCRFGERCKFFHMGVPAKGPAPLPKKLEEI